MNPTYRSQVGALLRQAEALERQAEVTRLFAAAMVKQAEAILAETPEGPSEPAPADPRPGEVRRRYLGGQELLHGSTKVHRVGETQTGERSHADPSDPEQPPQE